VIAQLRARDETREQEIDTQAAALVSTSTDRVLPHARSRGQ